MSNGTRKGQLQGRVLLNQTRGVEQGLGTLAPPPGQGCHTELGCDLLSWQGAGG